MCHAFKGFAERKRKGRGQPLTWDNLRGDEIEEMGQVLQYTKYDGKMGENETVLF